MGKLITNTVLVAFMLLGSAKVGYTIALALTLLVTGCAAFGGPPVQGQLTFCDGAAPLRPAKGETANLSDKLVGQINAHNALGQRACHWKPGG